MAAIGRSPQTPRNAVALPGAVGIATGEQQAGQAVEETEADQVTAQEGPAGMAGSRDEPAPTPRRYPRRAGNGVTTRFLERIAERIDGVVHQHAIEYRRGAIVVEPLVDQVIGKTSGAAAKQA